MTAQVDHTHASALRSWVRSANGHPDFPIQNLPLGIFSPLAGAPRGGIAIGDCILDLRALHETGILEGEAQAACAAAAGQTLNVAMAMGPASRVALRRAISALLAIDAPERSELLHAASDCLMYMPAHIGDYTDLYAGIHHATNVGKLFRPDNPLLPNYKYMPIGYHGRASSVRPAGSDVRRPNGQRKHPEDMAPSFGPARNLDYELELGIWVGPGNALGAPVPIGEAHEHIAGYCLLNDWSARDIQSWEYQPLGPFLSKSFHSTISCWVVTPEALAPFRVPQTPRAEGDPQPLPYLTNEADQQAGALDIELEVLITTQSMRNRGMAPHRLSLGNTNNLYWTPQQMLAHHTSNGCNLGSGDLLGTGTISSATPEGFGSLLEITQGGRLSFTLPSGEERRFLEDGDEIILRARARRDGYPSIGFGECRATIQAAPAL